jgi:hypothetical protein
MEFVFVTYPRLRDVFMDGAQQGQTGQTIAVQRGHHIFDLGDPQDYEPESARATVAGTSQTQPMIIAFDEADQTFAVIPRRASALVAARRSLAPGRAMKRAKKKKKPAHKRAKTKTGARTRRAKTSRRKSRSA